MKIQNCLVFGRISGARSVRGVRSLEYAENLSKMKNVAGEPCNLNFLIAIEPIRTPTAKPDTPTIPKNRICGSSLLISIL